MRAGGNLVFIVDARLASESDDVMVDIYVRMDTVIYRSNSQAPLLLVFERREGSRRQVGSWRRVLQPRRKAARQLSKVPAPQPHYIYVFDFALLHLEESIQSISNP